MSKTVMKIVYDIVRHDDKPIDKDERIEIIEYIGEFMAKKGYCAGGWVGTENELPNPQKLLDENADLRARLKSAEEERDEMKCCGNCGRNSNSLIGNDDGDCYEDDDQCLENVDNPNWTPRKAKS